MNARCPHCNTVLQLDEALAGRRAQCPSCQQVFTIPSASPRAASASRTPASVPLVWKLLVFIGAGLMIAAFFVPWWSIKITPPGALSESPWKTPEDQKNEIKDVTMAVLPHLEFYLNHVSADLVEYALDRDIDDIEDLVEPRRKSYGSSSGSFGGSSRSKRPQIDPFTSTLFGWDFTPAILVLIFGVFSGILMLFASVASKFRKWAWTLMLPAAGLSLAAAALAVSFWLASPGGDSENILSQSVIAGPFVAMGGAAVAMLGSIFGGMVSIRAFSRGLK